MGELSLSKAERILRGRWVLNKESKADGEGECWLRGVSDDVPAPVMRLDNHTQNTNSHMHTHQRKRRISKADRICRMGQKGQATPRHRIN
jgi:hypothetical protein